MNNYFPSVLLFWCCFFFYFFHMNFIVENIFPVSTCSVKKSQGSDNNAAQRKELAE
jgi:hypothetical protein